MHRLRLTAVLLAALCGAAPALCAGFEPLPDCPELLAPQADAWSWTTRLEEMPQLALDLAGPGTAFDLLADYEGTSILFRVRDAATGRSVAVIKTESLNTRVSAEVYAYRLATLLGFGELVVPTSPVRIEGAALGKLHALLASTTYDFEWKERARRKVLVRLEDALAAGEGLTAAIKPWMKAFMFCGELGDREKLARHQVMDCLLVRGTEPTDRLVTLRQYTQMYKPHGYHVGTISERDLARDLSNLMLLDALMAQNDRFAGGNLHYRSVSGELVEMEPLRGAPQWNMGPVRLFALDNGGALRTSKGIGLEDLMGVEVPGTRVERFDRDSVVRLRALARRVLGRDCVTTPDPDEVRGAWRALGLSGEDEQTAAALLDVVLDYLDTLREEHGEAMFLPLD